ncbi:MAG TPA: phytanoyl-CoA dioxygenase family protein [Candidatus Rubrimentiphilum sp.]|nr:phytanoyl-CoA dioxygenase family protein [Candidatus Rubrimentiphilum sp.]
MESAEREGLLRCLGASESRLTPPEIAALDRDGYVVLPGLLSAEQVANARAALDKLIAQARLDPTWHAGGTLHLNDLVNEPAFDPVWKSDRLLSAIVHVIGYDLRIGSVAYRAPKPGYGAQALHADFTPGYRGEYQVATAIVALVDFTPTNGATRVIPGSHLPGDVAIASDTDTPHPAQQSVTCGAGSAIVFNGHLLHSGTRNASQETRHALQMTFARPTAPIVGTAKIENATLERVGDAAFLFL